MFFGVNKKGQTISRLPFSASVYQELFLFGRSLLGRLEGIDPDVFGLDFKLLVGGEIAETRYPLLLRSGSH
jgi:hypothetical protein